MDYCYGLLWCTMVRYGCYDLHWVLWSAMDDCYEPLWSNAVCYRHYSLGLMVWFESYGRLLVLWSAMGDNTIVSYDQYGLLWALWYTMNFCCGLLWSPVGAVICYRYYCLLWTTAMIHYGLLWALYLAIDTMVCYDC